MRQGKPVIHAADHLANHADPIPGLITFDTYPQAGEYLSIEATGFGGVFNTGIGLSATRGGIQLQSDADDVGAGFVQINATGESSSIELRASGDRNGGVILSAYDEDNGGIIIHTTGAGNAAITLRQTDSPYPLGIYNEGDGPGGMEIWDKGDGSGGIYLASDNGGLYLDAGTDITIHTVVDTATIYLHAENGGDVTFATDGAGAIAAFAGGQYTVAAGAEVIFDAPAGFFVGREETPPDVEAYFKVLPGGTHGTVFMSHLPTSATGLTSGALWNNLGLVQIV